MEEGLDDFETKQQISVGDGEADDHGLMLQKEDNDEQKKQDRISGTSDGPSSKATTSETSPMPVPVRTGDIYKDFMPVRRIGEGTFAVVHRIQCLASGHQFACKTLDKEMHPNWVREAAFLSQASKIDGVAKLHFIYDESRLVHLICDLGEGGDLYDFINNQLNGGDAPILDEVVALRLAWETIHTCIALHREGLAHLDVKPENLVRCAEGPAAACYSALDLLPFL